MNAMTDPMHSLNRDAYLDQNVVRDYRSASTLLAPEVAILDRLKEKVQTAAMLDLGVGTGRTTQHLQDKCRSYVGIDYSAPMLRIARERFPDTDLREMDAADLSAFEDGRFDIALFSHNGIDAAPQRHRLRIIAEVHRVLRSEGVFIFSTHNRNTTIEAPLDFQNLKRARGLREFFDSVSGYVAGFVNAARMNRYKSHESEYAILNDCAHAYRLLHYYITPTEQLAQLERHGFTSVLCVGVGGEQLDSEVSRYVGPWLYYVARKR